MELFYYLVASTVGLVVDVLLFCMFIRAILSFLPVEGGFVGLLALITEPFIMPVRMICEKFGLGDGIPLDIPFFITAILLSMISMLV